MKKSVVGFPGLLLNGGYALGGSPWDRNIVVVMRVRYGLVFNTTLAAFFAILPYFSVELGGSIPSKQASLLSNEMSAWDVSGE